MSMSSQRGVESLSCVQTPSRPPHVSVWGVLNLSLWAAILSLCLTPPPRLPPPGCRSSPSPPLRPSHCWGPSETSSPHTSPPCFPPASPLALHHHRHRRHRRHRPPLLSACSKAGSQPRRISWPSCPATPSVGRRFQSSLRRTWSSLLRGEKRKEKFTIIIIYVGVSCDEI